MEGGRGEKGICACNWKRQGHTNLIFNRGTLVTTCILKGHGGSRCKTVYCAPRWLLAGRALSASREPLSAVHVAFLKNKIEGLRAILLFSFSPSLLLNPSPPPLNHPLIFPPFFSIPHFRGIDHCLFDCRMGGTGRGASPPLPSSLTPSKPSPSLSNSALVPA